MSNNQGLLCPDCMKVFSDVNLLTSHFEESHNNKENTTKIEKEGGVTNQSNIQMKSESKINTNHEKTDKSSPKSNETKNKSMNKIAASLGGFINNFSLKPATNTNTNANANGGHSSRSLSGFESLSSNNDLSNEKNKKAHRVVRLKQHCVHLGEHNKMLMNILRDFCNVKDDMDGYRELVTKCNDLLTAQPTIETPSSIPLKYENQNEEHISIDNVGVAQETTSSRSIAIELEAKVVELVRELEDMKHKNSVELEKLRHDYEATIETITTEQSKTEVNDDGEVLIQQNLKLIKEAHDLREKLSNNESLLDKTTEHHKQIETILNEKTTELQSLSDTHKQELTKYKTKMEKLIDSQVKSRNEKKQLESELASLKQSMSKYETDHQQLNQDNEEITKNLLLKNDQVNFENKNLNDKLAELSRNYNNLQVDHSKLEANHKNCINTYNESKKLVETLKGKNSKMHESQKSLMMKLEKEITKNGELNQKISQLEEQLTRLHKTNDSKNDQYNNLVMSYEKERSKYKIENENILKRLQQSDEQINHHIDSYNKLKSQYDMIYSQNQCEQARIDEQSAEIKRLSQCLSSHDDYVNGLLEKISLLESRESQLEHNYREGNLALCELDEENRKLKRKICEIYSRYWKTDVDYQNCTKCNTEFNFTKRKHHCRNCGDIICEKCGSLTTNLPCGPNPERVCELCFEEIKHFRNQL